MPRMMAYLGGDTNTLACRRAKNNDIRLAVEYPDSDRMLVISVMQTGEVMLAWTKVRGSEKVEHIEVVGKVIENNGDLLYLPGHSDPSDFIPSTTVEPVTFDHTILRVVRDDSEEDESF